MNGNNSFAIPSSSTTRSNPHSRKGRPKRLAPEDIQFLNDDSANLWSPCSNCSSSDENNSPTVLNTINWDKPALEDKSVDFVWTSANHKGGGLHEISVKNSKDCHVKGPSGYVTLQSESTKDLSQSFFQKENSSRKVDRTDGVINSSDEEIARFREQTLHRTVVNTECNDFHETSSDSYLCMSSSEEVMKKEKEGLKNVPWFQAGIPREIALEVLVEKPEGSFIVRESTTKPGCYALSLRVPVEKNPTGIAHYLILHTNKGYKIKGFTKEFPNLRALITHHSVMPELLPCPLSLPRPSTRDAEREFEETEQKPYDVFEDIHWLMNDLEM